MFCCNCGRELESQARFCSVCGTPRAPENPPRWRFNEQSSFTRIREGKKIAGVCGGVARYFDMDVTLVRILWVFITIFPPLPGIVAYIVCWIAMPQDPIPVRDTPDPASGAPRTVDA